MTRPRDKTILNLVKYLNSIGLNVYGQTTNLETGEEYCSNSDFAPEDIVKYRKLVEEDKLWNVN